MNIGEFKTPITIERFETGTDEDGFNIEQWSVIASPRAKVEFDERLMREIFRDDMVNSTLAKIFSFRKHRQLNITVKDSIVCDNVRYEIYGINDLGTVYKVWARTILNV